MGIPSTSAFGLEHFTVIAGSGAENEANNGGTNAEEANQLVRLTNKVKHIATTSLFLTLT